MKDDIANRIETYNGVTGTIIFLCQVFNLNFYKIKKDMDEGMSFNEAVGSKSIYFSIFKNGDEEGTINYYSKKYDIPVSSIVSFLNAGGTISECISEYSVSSIDIYEYRGSVGTVEEICEEFNIRYKAVKALAENGFTVMEAFDRAPRVSEIGNVYTYKGYTGTISEILKFVFPNQEEYKKNYSIINQRVRLGYSLEEAIDKSLVWDELFSYTSASGIKKKGTIKEIAADHDIPEVSLYNTYNKEKKIDYAVYLCKMKK